MSEFGHTFTRVQGACIDTWGSGPFVIKDASGRAWRFEDSDRFGPAILNQDDSVKARQPGERSLFWRPHALWRFQGRETLADGITCIWREPRPTKMRKHGRELVIVEHGEEHGRELIVDEDGSVVGEMG